MDISRKSTNPRNRSSDHLERRMDQWLETGRQFVDGVAGNRPGQRRQINQRFNRSSLDNVGRWVGDKVDWFFEDEDDFRERPELETHYEDLSRVQKKPLQAISLRVPKAIAPSSQPSQGPDTSEGDNGWPDDSSFRVERWKRSEVEEQRPSNDVLLPNRQRLSLNRPLPKSSRKRI